MKKKIIHEGELNLNGLILPCYVLEDGTRVLSGRGMQNSLKIGQTDDRKEELKSGVELSRFIGSKWFNSLEFKGLMLEHFSPIECYKGNQKINGYEATILVDICDILLNARNIPGVKFSEKQSIIAAQCEILVRSFAKIGIIALVDEATGYQYDREKDELSVIFQALISDEVLEHQKQFHLSFYKEIFRLWKIPFTAQNIRRKPQFIGHLTNKFIYKNMPKGYFVLEELKKRTPKTEAGKYKYRFHQSLTKDKGVEMLKKVLYSVEALASISNDKREFERLMNEKYGQKEIPFTDVDELDPNK